MKWNSIITKLWVVITLLVLLVIGIAGAVQTRFIQDLYYYQQANQLISIGNKVAQLALAEKNPHLLDMKVAVASDMLDGNVMIIDENGIVKVCHGMGISIRNMPMGLDHPHHGPLTNNDLERLFGGETIIYKGKNEYFNTEVLSVAIPVNNADRNIGAVMIHAPLKPLAGQLANFQGIINYSAVGGILLATVLSLIFSRRVSRPLRDMSRVSLAMASGDFSRQVKVNSNDEIGLLADSLNTLSARLQEKLAQLEKTDQTRREFVTNVSHEIKTPLTIMQVSVEVLQDNLIADEHERRVYLNNIHEEILRLRRLVNDVLDLKKMEEGYGDFEKELINFDSIIKSVQNKFNPLQEETGVNLIYTVDNKLPRVFCNKDRMEQVFINLIDNAVRHTPKNGEVHVTVSSKADSIMIKIRDTGKGIPDEDLPMIWERFYRGDKSRTRTQGGTGLGLAIVKGIVEAHGGFINVQSKLGEGTTFNVILPTSENYVRKDN